MAIGLTGPLAARQPVPQPDLHARRRAGTDLELAGLNGIVPGGKSRFVSRTFLLTLPRVTVHLEQFEDFPAITSPGVMVSGIYLDVLAKALGAEVTTASAIEAICADGYAAAFPAGYIQVHRPIFVLAIDGLPPHEWAVQHKTYDPGPYFIAYEHFAPHFRVLAHDDRPLEPDQIAKLLFSTKAVIYAGIEPKENSDPANADSPVVSGFRIARQNCFRCHNSGEFGGTQAGLSFKKLGKIAAARPDYFAAWVHDPQAVDPKSKMPANKSYDQTTLEAITRYFATIAVEGK
jgi:mono/diheme cytochrome c family protein